MGMNFGRTPDEEMMTQTLRPLLGMYIPIRKMLERQMEARRNAAEDIRILELLDMLLSELVSLCRKVENAMISKSPVCDSYYSSGASDSVSAAVWKIHSQQLREWLEDIKILEHNAAAAIRSMDALQSADRETEELKRRLGDLRDYLGEICSGFERYYEDDDQSIRKWRPRAAFSQEPAESVKAIFLVDRSGSMSSSSRYEHSLGVFRLAQEFTEHLKEGRSSWKKTVDEVQFRCAAPLVIRPGKYFTAKVMMYREDDTDRADRESRLVDDKVRVGSSDVVEAEKGKVFTIRLQSADIPDLDEVGQLRWNGKYAARDFQILLPEDYTKDQLRLVGRVYDDLTPLTDIRLLLEVSGTGGQEVLCEKTTLRTAFVSYSSKDRSEVVKRIQGMETVRDDMDIFIDVESLRRGEEYEPRLLREIRERDLFYLFWSRNAAESDWVRKELDYAVKNKAMDRIEPIALEDPDVCPPPESLKKRHFRDWTLKYTT